MTTIILLGAPGSGKGTQSQLISDKFLIPFLTMGDIIRHEIKNETKIGLEMKSYTNRGELVPDSIISDLFLTRLTKEFCKQDFILDGVPRTLLQAKQLTERLNSYNVDYKVFLIDVSLVNILDRLRKRNRNDDAADVVEKRFRIYQEELSPILSFYGSNVIKVDGERDVEVVFKDICSKLN